MCPDVQTLSAFFDDELEKHFSDRIKEHISHCPKCREQMGSFGEVSSYLQTIPEPDFERSKYAVWHRLQETKEMHNNGRFWRRTIAIPMPLVVASGAFFVIVMSVFLLLFSFNMRYNNTVSFLARGEVQNTEVFMADLEKVNRYLESQNEIIEVNMQLPKQTQFIKGGEPQLVREKEFSNLRQ